MKFVRTTVADESGFVRFLDPLPYLDALPWLSKQLPMGARKFATDPDHYNFAGKPRCVKDLKLGRICIRENSAAGQVVAEIAFSPNPFKHDTGLVIRYLGVARFRVDTESLEEFDNFFYPEGRRLGDVEVDEILPVPAGCTHEVKLTAGTIFVECRDLLAEWRDMEG